MKLKNQNHENNSNHQSIRAGRCSTIKGVQSGRPGSRVSLSTGRKVPFPSYYAIGRYFEILFDMDPNIKIYSLGKRIEPNEIWNNWGRQLEYIERGSILEQ